MQIKNAQFIASNTNYQLCPKDDKAEYAFIGRSNVGKSSLINMLVNHQGLAKTSSKPGKTQLINHFLINDKNIISSENVFLIAIMFAKETANKKRAMRRYDDDIKLQKEKAEVLR